MDVFLLYERETRHRYLRVSIEFTKGLSSSDFQPSERVAVWNSSEIHSTNQIPLKPLNKLG